MEYLAATTEPRIFTSCVSLFVVAHVHDHTPFPVPLRRHRTILVDDEAMFRQAFGNLACFSSAEKHMCIVLVMECLVTANWPPPSRTRWSTIIRLEFWTCL